MSTSIEQALATETAARIAADQALAASAAATNYAAAYRLIRDFGKFRLTGLTVAGGPYILVPANGAAGVPGSAVPAATDGSADGEIFIDPADYAVSGKTTNARLISFITGNATNPGAACAFTFSLVLAGAASGANAPRIALGAAPNPTMSVAQTPNSTNFKVRNGSGDKAIAGWGATVYVLQLAISGADMAAGSFVTADLKLEVHNT